MATPRGKNRLISVLGVKRWFSVWRLRPKWLTVFLTALLLFLLFLLRCQALQFPNFKDGTKIRIHGVLREEPAVVGRSQIFHLKGIKIKTFRFPEYHYGQKLIITGIIRVRVLNHPQIKQVKSGQIEFFSWAFKLKRKIEGVYGSILPEPQSSLLAGIVLGSKRSLSSGFSKALRKTGTMHIVVASGSNISFVGQPLVDNLSGWISRQAALPIGLAFIWLYALMAGFEPPVVRAAIMLSFAFLAQFLGRRKDVLLSLFLSGFLMLFINPMLVFNLGFQLSFGATLGILLFQPKIKPFFKRIPVLGDDLATTLAAQVFVLPIIYFKFRQWPLLSPLVNALVLWTVPILMKLGGLIAFFGLFSQALARLLSYPSWLFLTYFIKVIAFLG